MTAAAPAISLPSDSVPNGNPPAAAHPPVAAAGAEFSDLARVILAASPETDTADALDAALASGDREVARIEVEIDAAQRIAVDPLATADDAATAEAHAVALGLALRRTRSAVGQLESRLTAYQRRAAEMRAEAERRAVLDRHERAVAAFLDLYAEVAPELAARAAELKEAERAVFRAKLDKRADHTTGQAIFHRWNDSRLQLPKISAADREMLWPPVVTSLGQSTAFGF